MVGLAAVFYYAYASFFVLEKTCLLCVAIYVAVVGIFFVSSAAAPSGIAVLKDAGRDLSGVLANPAALGLGAAWLVASLALVGLFPRESDRRRRGPGAGSRGPARNAGSGGPDGVAPLAGHPAEKKPRRCPAAA